MTSINLKWVVSLGDKQCLASHIDGMVLDFILRIALFE